MPPTEDQGNATMDMTILLPGEMPQGAEDTVATGAGASPTGDEENMKAAFEAAGLKAPEPTTATTGTTQLDAGLIEALKKLDPTTLPPDVQEHLDRHFQPAFTKKTQALADERRELQRQREEILQQRERLLDRIGSAKELPGDKDRLAELREKIRSGDMDAIDQYADAVFDKKMAPMEGQMKIRDAYDTATANEPLVAQHKEVIAATFKEQPVLLELLAAEKFRFAPLVFTALARDIELSRVQQHVAGEAQRTQEAVTKALTAYKERVRGLPDTTSLAGTTTQGPTTEKPPSTMEEARAKTLRDLKGMGLV